MCWSGSIQKVARNYAKCMKGKQQLTSQKNYGGKIAREYGRQYAIKWEGSKQRSLEKVTQKIARVLAEMQGRKLAMNCAKRIKNY